MALVQQPPPVPSGGRLASTERIDEYGVVDDLDESDQFDNAVRTAEERGTSRAVPTGGDYFKSRQAAMAELMGTSERAPVVESRRLYIGASEFVVRLSSLEVKTAFTPQSDMQLQLLVQGRHVHEAILPFDGDSRRTVSVPFQWDPPLEFACLPNSNALGQPIVFILSVAQHNAAHDASLGQSRVLGYGTIDLSRLTADLVDSRVPIVRPGPTLPYGSSTEVELGEVICSVMSVSANVGLQPTAGYSKLGRPVSAGFQRPVSATSRQGWSNCSCQRPASAAPMRSVPSGVQRPHLLGSRPTSAVTSSRPFSASSARGSVYRAPGCKRSASSFHGFHGGSSILTANTFGEEVRAISKSTPPGFQYQAIPDECLSVTTSAPSQRGFHMSGALGAAARFHSGISSAPKLSVCGVEPLNSHQVAEGFWSFWRQKQLPEGLPRVGELVVMAEVRHGHQTGMTTKHEANKYQTYLEKLRSIVSRVVGDAAVVIVVPGDATQWQTPHGPRLGAFELQLFFKEQGMLKSELLHSKLATRKWPSTAKIEAALLRQVHTIRMHPVVICTDGSARPVLPLPKMGLLKGYRNSKDSGSTISLTNEENWISARLPRGCEDCYVQVPATGDYVQYLAPLGTTAAMNHSPDGAFDATIILDSKPRQFKLPIVTEVSGSKGRRLADMNVTFKLLGRKTAACSLHDTVSVKTDNKGEAVIMWTGHVEHLELLEGTIGSGGSRVVDTWPSWSADQGAVTLPQCIVQLNRPAPKAAPAPAPPAPAPAPPPAPAPAPPPKPAPAPAPPPKPAPAPAPAPAPKPAPAPAPPPKPAPAPAPPPKPAPAPAPPPKPAPAPAPPPKPAPPPPPPPDDMGDSGEWD
ncbi:hypothetical protein AB1Y20_018081 [Prymnesium parvum]|uniref:Uncharacterized protein n=1 Tax=Prymnesium parvum TaxID=97485 RepID=A0AB34JM37_PRYPA